MEKICRSNMRKLWKSSALKHCPKLGSWKRRSTGLINEITRVQNICLKRRTGLKLENFERLYFLRFFSTRPSDEYDSAPSRKYARPLLDVFTCGQVSSPCLYRLRHFTLYTESLSKFSSLRPVLLFRQIF